MRVHELVARLAHDEAGAIDTAGTAADPETELANAYAGETETPANGGPLRRLRAIWSR